MVVRDTTAHMYPTYSRHPAPSCNGRSPAHAQRLAGQSADALPLADPSSPVQTRTLPSLVPSFRGKGRQEFTHRHSHSKKPEKNGNYCVKKRGVKTGDFSPLCLLTLCVVC